jgi:hypothetical protein
MYKRRYQEGSIYFRVGFRIVTFWKVAVIQNKSSESATLAKDLVRLYS